MVLVPVATLVVLSLTNPAEGKTSARTALATMAAAMLGLLAIRALLPDEVIWPNSEVMRRCRWLVRHLESKPGWESTPVVILTGSSATMYGLDPERIEHRLAEAGRYATVLPLSMSGATLHERRYMLQNFIRLLGREGRQHLKSADLIVLNEVFDAYDHNPLYRMEKEAFSQRLIQFLNPENAAKAWEAYTLQLSTEPDLPKWSVASSFVRHALLNIFAVGAAAEMEWPRGKKKKTGPFFALDGHKGNFDYAQTCSAFEDAAQHPERGTVRLPFSQGVLSLTHLLEPLRSYRYRQGFYALPTLEPVRRNYAQDLRQAVGPSTAFIGPASRADLEPMLSEDVWYDGVHPTGKGAELFSDWFASKLVGIL